MWIISFRWQRSEKLQREEKCSVSEVKTDYRCCCCCCCFTVWQDFVGLRQLLELLLSLLLVLGVFVRVPPQGESPVPAVRNITDSPQQWSTSCCPIWAIRSGGQPSNPPPFSKVLFWIFDAVITRHVRQESFSTLKWNRKCCLAGITWICWMSKLDFVQVLETSLLFSGKLRQTHWSLSTAPPPLLQPPSK